MSFARGIGIQSDVPIPGQSMVHSSAADGTASASVGGNSAQTTDAADFRQRWQAILDNLRGFEEVTGTDGPQAREEGCVVSVSTSSPRPATELQHQDDWDANHAGESSSQTASSELTGMSRRTTLHVLASGHLPSSPDANRASTKIGVYDTTVRSQRLSGSNIKSAKIEAGADSVKATSAMNPEFSPNPTTMPLLVLPSQADNPSGQAASARVVSGSLVIPFGYQHDSRATTTIVGLTDTPDRSSPILGATPDGKHDGHPSSASSPSLVSKRASGEADGTDQFVAAPLEKSAPVQPAPQPPNTRSLQTNFNGQSASGSTFPPTTQSSNLPNSPYENVTQTKGTETSVVDRLRPDNRVNIRETATTSRSKLDADIPSIHWAANSAVTQNLEDDRVGQPASGPGAGVVPSPGSGLAASVASVKAQPDSAREPLAVMDAGTDSPSAKWISAGGHRAEAGFQDSSLGWVSVRAQLDAGGIHAAVVPSSEIGAQVLGSHLAGLNSDMANRHEHLNPITLSAPDAGSNSQNTGRGMSQGDGAYTGRDGQQQRPEGPEFARTESVAHSSHGFAEEPMSGLEMQASTAGPNPIDGHVSFVV